MKLILPNTNDKLMKRILHTLGDDEVYTGEYEREIVCRL